MIVSVRRQEWFVFRRYAEFDKLYNTVSARQSDKVDVEFCKVDPLQLLTRAMSLV